MSDPPHYPDQPIRPALVTDSDELFGLLAAWAVGWPPDPYRVSGLSWPYALELSEDQCDSAPNAAVPILPTFDPPQWLVIVPCTELR